MAIYALLDLDETLIDTEATQFNEALLEALREFGITDICLFTSMDNRLLLDDVYGAGRYTRPAIIQKLEAEGFRVHKVITPPDLAFVEVGDYYTKKWLPAYKDLKETNADIEAEDTHSKARAVDEEKNAYQQSANEEAASLGTETQRREAYAKAAMGKAELYQKILGQLDTIPLPDSEPITSFIYFDDREEELRKVAEVNTKAGIPLPLTTVPIQTRNSAEKLMPDIPSQPHEIDSYPARKEAIKDRYKTWLTEHILNLPKQQKEGLTEQQSQAAEVFMSHLNSQQTLLSNLLKDIEGMRDDYKTLDRTKHDKDIKLLQKQVKNIMQYEEVENLTPEELTQKIREVVTALELAFHKEDTHFRKPFLSIGSPKRPEVFINKLNQSQEYQYPRLLSMSLQMAYNTDPSLMNISKKLDRPELIMKIQPGSDQIYSRKINSLLGDKQLIEPFRDIANQLSNLSSNRLDAIVVYRLYKGQQQLDFNKVKDVVKIWPELKTNLKLSDREIQDYLNAKGHLDPKSTLDKKLKRLEPMVNPILYTLNQALTNQIAIKQAIRSLDQLKDTQLAKPQNIRYNGA